MVELTLTPSMQKSEGAQAQGRLVDTRPGASQYAHFHHRQMSVKVHVLHARRGFALVPKAGTADS